MPQIKVVTACRSRFYIFEQANQLNRFNKLLCLIADYPKLYPIRYGIPSNKIKSLLILGVITHGWTRLCHYLPFFIRAGVDQIINLFSTKIISFNIPKEVDYFICMSSFALDSIKFCKKNNITSIVEHASLHLSDQVKFAQEEANRWGVKNFDKIPDWVIEKENKEFELADKIFCVSETVKQSLIRNGVRADKIYVNYLGVDLTKYVKNDARKRDKKAFEILQVGGINLPKGVLTLLNAVKDIEGNVIVNFAGGGIKSSGIIKNIQAIKSDKIKFHGSLSFDKLLALYQSVDVFVLASVADGFGLVVAQAMSCSLPVIVTENVGAKDLVQDGVNGFIVKPGDSAGIANKINLLYNNRDLCLRMGEAARKSVSSGFTWDDYGNRLNGFLN
jgi:glycosyltransferase involved in cell wall biosynthesis